MKDPTLTFNIRFPFSIFPVPYIACLSQYWSLTTLSSLGLTFCYDVEDFDVRRTVPLCPGGDRIPVTNSNKVRGIII
jgi:hypothetical protein